MDMTIGILRDAACPSVADAWPQAMPAGPQVIVSPPEPLETFVRRARVIIVDVPDARLRENLEALRRVVAPETLLVSLSPVVPLEVIRSLIGEGVAILRAVILPGTEPGDGVVALAPEPRTSGETVEIAREALSWTGLVEVMAEDALDAIAALALGGAIFLCEALEGLEEGAVRDGMPRDTARAFAYHTALATAVLLRDHRGSPADLKDQVASPGGTTIAALATLEDAGVRGAYLRAVERTTVEVRRRRDAARPGVIE